MTGLAKKYYAHTAEGQPQEAWEHLSTHLAAVADGGYGCAGAACFAAAFGAREFGRLLGLWHDLGKYSEAFQAYLASSAGTDAHLETPSGRVDHSTAGAQHAARQGGRVGKLLAYCIAGHHGGLPDAADCSGGTAGLEDRLRKPIPAIGSPLRAAPIDLLKQACPARLPLNPLDEEDARAFQAAVLCRMLFSCLVDADFLATEGFMDPERAAARKSRWPQPAELLGALDRHLEHKQASSDNTEVNRKRREVLEACRAAAAREPGLFSLTVPTGGGKSLSSLVFALSHANRHGLRRVIYAIPFTSIIEQNGGVFREALRAAGADAVLEHHSNLDPERETHWARLASENWEAPVIVTTNVQFFESLFANRPSRCRKLHRIARSVIILDEVQTLPVELLHPSLAILDELRRNYGCTVVLCSATQPAVELRDEFPIGLSGVTEIAPRVPELFAALKRVNVEIVGQLSDEALCGRLREHTQVLCIVNTRRHAAELYKLLTSEGSQGCLHLSAQMCGQHRSAVLRLIRRKLRSGEPCRVVSTQLVEAGVDVDFPVVYRAMGGVDSIAQAAGRCNREGRRACGEVFVFETEAGAPHHVAQAAQDTREVCRDQKDLLGPAAVEEYFRLHYWKRKDQWDRHKVMGCFGWAKDGLHAQFREAAERYRMIRDERMPVIVPYGRRGRRLVEALWQMDRPPGREFDRRVQRYIVTLHERSYRKLLDNGMATIRHERFCVLEIPTAYDRRLGLRLDVSGFDPSGLIV